MQHYYKTKKIISFTPYLTDADIEQMAIKSGFQVRTPKKILPSVLVKLLLEQVVKHSPSYNDIASNMEKHTGISVSRQAISRRVNDFRVEPPVARKAPPQTRTSAINASGSSKYTIC